MLGTIISLLAGTGLAMFHVGVELQWFTTGCTASISATTPEELRKIIMSAPLIPCNEVAWTLWSISMAGWNAILSLLLALITLYSILKTR
jgi:disulfide bond formation protein DsbB